MDVKNDFVMPYLYLLKNIVTSAAAMLAKPFSED